MSNLYAGNQYEFSFTHAPGTTLWRVRTYTAVGNLGAYATVAAALAAGQQLFPHYGMVRRVRLKVTNATGDGPGSPWYYAINRGDPDFGNLASDAMRDQLANFQLGTDEVVMDFHDGLEIWSFWNRLTTSTDRLSAQFIFY